MHTGFEGTVPRRSGRDRRLEDLFPRYEGHWREHKLRVLCAPEEIVVTTVVLRGKVAQAEAVGHCSLQGLRVKVVACVCVCVCACVCVCGCN